MTFLLQALERHIPEVQSLLSEEPFPYEAKKWEGEGGEETLFCAYGLSFSLYETLRPWLDEKRERRLVFVEDRPAALHHLLQESDAILLLNDRRVKLFFLETPLQVEPSAKRIAWKGVLQKIRFVNLSPSPWAPSFEKALLEAHRAASLILSDVADFGLTALRHAKAHLPSRFALDLRFPNVPALIVGAGPSLEPETVASLQDRALVLSGGSALSLLPFSPHLAFAIDPDLPVQTTAPLCLQARSSPENFSSRETLLIPDTHFPFLNWLAGEERPFDGGWTVGTCMAALAAHWGCNPIVFVGMDLCYREGKKYAEGRGEASENLIEEFNEKGERVWTQPDWVQAAHWLRELQKRYPHIEFYNASQGGLALAESISLQEIQWPKREIRIEIPKERPSFSRWEEWKESLLRCQKGCTLAEERSFFEGEIAYQMLLLPLWQVWRFVFEREVECDSAPLSHEEKMWAHELLFYASVIEEHLHAL